MKKRGHRPCYYCDETFPEGLPTLYGQTICWKCAKSISRAQLEESFGNIRANWRYCVIIGIDPITCRPEDDYIGPNLVDGRLYEVEGKYIVADFYGLKFADNVEFKLIEEELPVKVPAFNLGQIIIVDGNGIEAPGCGRKPWKVDVKTYTVDNLEEALRTCFTVTKPLPIGLELPKKK